MTNLTFRTATLTDAETVAALTAEAVEGAGAPGAAAAEVESDAGTSGAAAAEIRKRAGESGRTGTERTLAGVVALLNDPRKGFCTLAETEGRAGGQVTVTYEWSDWRNGVFWWIQSVSVGAEFEWEPVLTGLCERLLELARGSEGVCGLRVRGREGSGWDQDVRRVLRMETVNYRFYEIDFGVGKSERD